MIKTLLLSTLYSALRAYLGSGIYDRIVSEVIYHDEPGLTERQRKDGKGP